MPYTLTGSKSFGACIIIAGSAILRARTLKQAARRAQQIELGAIVFDKNGRLLIDSSGGFPCTVVTDFFIGGARGVRHHPLLFCYLEHSTNTSSLLRAQKKSSIRLMNNFNGCFKLQGTGLVSRD